MEKLTLVAPTGYNAQTLKGLLDRIKGYIAEIGREAALLELLAAGKDVSSTSTLAEIAEALFTIGKFSAADATLSSGASKTTDKEELVLNAGSSATVKAGYYVNDVTIKATALANLSEGTATSGMIIDGATAWVNGVQLAGTLSLDKDKILTTLEWTDKDGNTQKGNIVTNTVSSLAATNSGLATDATKATATIEINRYTEADGGTTQVANSVTIPKGYYATDIVVTPTFKDSEGNTEDILNYTNYTIPSTISLSDGKATIKPADVNVDYFGEVTVEQFSGEVDSTTGGLKVTKSGWIDKSDTTYQGLSEGSYVTSNTGTNAVTIVDGKAVINKAKHGYTPDKIEATLPVNDAIADQTNVTVTADNTAGTASFETTVSIPAGYYEEDTVTIKGSVDLSSTIAGSHTVSMAEAKAYDDAAAADKVTITSQYVTDAVKHGYIASDSTKQYKVRDAVLGNGSLTVATGTVTIPVATTGWRNDDVTFTMPTQQAATTFTPDSTGTTIAAGTYLSGDFTVAATTVNNATVTYDSATSTNIANVEGAKVTTTSKDAATTTFYDTVDMSALLSEMAAV